MQTTDVKRRAAALALLGALAASGMALPPLHAAPTVSGAPASPGSQGPVDIKLTAYKVVTQDGKDELQPAEKIKPGEVIEYRAQYANTGNAAVKGLAATLPIPAALEFLPGTESPDGVQASTDGKSYAAPPLKHISKAADGSTKIVIVPAAEYRFLRWNVGELGAGKSVTVSARARVLGPIKTTATHVTNATAGKGGGH